MGQCISDHSTCQKRVIKQRPQNESQKFPTRLLDLGDVDPTTSITLCKGDTLPINTHYLTSSHCWGESPAFRLLVAKEAEFIKHEPYSALPQTFRDAIDFTHALKKRYLWIDAVCIIQDSESDWLNEAIMMDSVYSGSWLNLAATSSKDGNGGLLPPRNPFYETHV